MILDFKTHKQNTYNCYDAMIAVVGDYYSIDIAPIFLDSFGFVYQANEIKELSLNSSIGYITNYNDDFLRDFCGIEVKYTQKDLDIEGIVINNIKTQELTGIHMDSFYLPWSKMQYEHHQNHFFIIIGFEDNKYICIDNFLAEGIVSIDKKIINENALRAIKFAFNKNNIIKYDLSDIITIILKHIGNEQNHHIDHLKKFTFDFQNFSFNIDNYKIGSEARFNLFQGLSNIEWSRYNFVRALNYISDKFGSKVFENVIVLVNNAHNQWQIVKYTLIRSLLTNNKAYYAKKISDMLYEITNTETEIICTLLNLNNIYGIGSDYIGFTNITNCFNYNKRKYRKRNY
jgi:hypothetical protein